MPGTGPTNDERRNSRIIGRRQLDAAKQVAATSGETLSGPLDSRMMYVLVRIGTHYLVCLPAEITIVAGLRIRRVVAESVGSDLDHVLVQGYANGYAHYVTSREEYEFQNYEGGSTIFGRDELAVVTEAVGELARAMATGTIVDSGRPPPPQKIGTPSPSGSPRWSRKRRATVTAAPTSTTAGWSICAAFATNHPNDPIQSNYFFVEHRRSDRWIRIADDSSPSTEIEWSKDRKRRFHATVTWHIPENTEPGLYRITYLNRTKPVPTEPIEVSKRNGT